MADSIKIGIVGLDISHCTAFTQIFHDREFEYFVPGADVIAAYPGGSPMFSKSRERVKGFTEELRSAYGVPIIEDLSEIADQADGILLESVDGRQHLEQFKQLAVGKPVFIDKPFACSTEDAREIIDIAIKTDTPIVSCSSIRFAPQIHALISSNENVSTCEAYGPAALLDDYPGLFWYGIHSAEVLFSFMGGGCLSVRCLEHPCTDVVLGEWEDGRAGLIRGTRFEDSTFGCIVHTSGGVYHGVSTENLPSYHVMLQKLVEFFQSGISPIDIEETFQIIAFVEAANKSKEKGGRPVDLAKL